MSTDELKTELVRSLDQMVIYRMTTAERRDFRRVGERLLEILITAQNARTARAAMIREKEGFFRTPDIITPY